jgi:hypothetical protein
MSKVENGRGAMCDIAADVCNLFPDKIEGRRRGAIWTVGEGG